MILLQKSVFNDNDIDTKYLQRKTGLNNATTKIALLHLLGAMLFTTIGGVGGFGTCKKLAWEKQLNSSDSTLFSVMKNMY